MPRKIPQLSKLQISRIRANLSRKASQLGNRLSAHALGETGKDGKPVEMSPSQIKAAQVILGHILPAQAQTQVEDLRAERADPLSTKRQLEETLLELAASGDAKFKRELQQRIDTTPELVTERKANAGN